MSKLTSLIESTWQFAVMCSLLLRVIPYKMYCLGYVVMSFYYIIIISYITFVTFVLVCMSVIAVVPVLSLSVLFLFFFAVSERHDITSLLWHFMGNAV